MNDSLLSLFRHLPSLVDGPWWYTPLLKITLLLLVAWVVHFSVGRLNLRWRVMLWRSVVLGVLVTILLDVSQLTSFSMPVKPDAFVSALASDGEDLNFKSEGVSAGVENASLGKSFGENLVLQSRSSENAVGLNSLTTDLDRISAIPEFSHIETGAAPGSIYDSWFLSLPGVLSLVWLAGVLFAILLEFVARRRLRSIIAASAPGSTSLNERANEIADAMGASRCSVRVSQQVESPMVCFASFVSREPSCNGRRALVLPKHIVENSDEQEMGVILTHELSHIASRDLEWNLLIKIITTVLWFQPLLWPLRKTHMLACEYVADSNSARRLQDPSLYVRTLAKVALEISAGSRQQLPGLSMARVSNVRLRLDRVKDSFSQLPLSRRRVATFLSVLFLACMTLGAFKLVYAQPAVDLDSDETTMLVEVVDEEGSPIGDSNLSAKVFVETTRPGENVDAEQVSEGVFRIAFPKDIRGLQLLATSERRVRMMTSWRQKDIQKGLPEKHTITLAAGTKVSGRVVDEQGKPIENAKVHLLVRTNQNKRSYHFYYDYFVTTGKDGRWNSDKMPARLEGVWVKLEHSDFISDSTFNETIADVSAATLRAGTLVTEMKKGVIVSGSILDQAGNLVEGATVYQSRGHQFSNHEDTKAKDGKFQLENCKPGELTLTVVAKGFAPEMTTINIARSNESVTLNLKKGGTIKIRVVDSSAKPLDQALVNIGAWRGSRSLSGTQANRHTDADGVWIWEDAPADAVEFAFHKTGYMGVQNKSLVGQSEFHVISLSPQLDVTGTVTDAQTGKSVENFKVVPGICWENNKSITWEHRSAVEGDDGKYEYGFSYPRHAHKVRVEAIGYSVAESRELKSNEGKVTLDFQLTPTDAMTGVVMTPQGKPAADVKIFVGLANKMNMINNGRVSDSSVRTVVTNEAGVFAFPSEDEDFMLLCLHQSGVATILKKDFRPGATIRLEAWAKISGTVSANGKPSPRAKVSLGDVTRSQYPLPGFLIDSNATSDDKGRFEFAQVRPNVEVNVARVVESGSGNSRRSSLTQNVKVQTKPSETNHVKIGAIGRSVTGRVAVPSTVPDYRWGRLTVKPYNPFPQGTKDWTQESWQKWQESEAGVEFKKRQDRHYSFSINDDGSFQIDDLPPDEYELRVSIALPLDRDQPRHIELGQTIQRFTLEKANLGDKSPHDLGAIPLKLHTILQSGEAAPALKFSSLAGKEMSLKQFQGKVVVLDFWSTTCRPCLKQMPQLDAIYERFGDKDFEIVGVSIDQKLEDAKAYLADHPHAWIQGHLSLEQFQSVGKAYGVRGVPAIYVIDGEGNIVGSGLSVDDAEKAVAKLFEEKDE